MNPLIKKITGTTQNLLSKVLSLSRKHIYKIISNRLVAEGLIIVPNPIIKPNNSENKKIFNLILSLKKESRQFLSDFDLLHLYTLINKTEKIRGNVAEVGVFKGGSAKIICETTKKRVYLFDTFEGLPKPHQEDARGYKKGDYSSSFEDAKNYLKKYRNATLYKGLFPLTSKPIESKKFSLVHLDTDLYKSTLDCLEFFYPRLSKGGVIICHDYGGRVRVGRINGVKKAVDKFFKNKPEIIIEPLAGSSQAGIIIRHDYGTLKGAKKAERRKKEEVKIEPLVDSSQCFIIKV